MGTRSVTYFHNGTRGDPVLCAVYQQFDGYPSSVGQELADFLKSKTLTNGISGNRHKIFNGMQCAAAQFVAHAKTEAGGVYMTFPDADGEEYNYHVFYDGDLYNPEPGAMLSIEVSSTYGDTAWTGPVNEFDGDAIENQGDGDDE